MHIPVTWNMTDEITCEREIRGVLEAARATRCDNLFIVTKDEERIISRESKQINIVPAWKWLLQPITQA